MVFFCHYTLQNECTVQSINPFKSIGLVCALLLQAVFVTECGDCLKLLLPFETDTVTLSVSKLQAAGQIEVSESTSDKFKKEECQ